MFKFGHHYTFTLVAGHWSLDIQEMPDPFARPIVVHDFGVAELTADEKVDALATLTMAICVGAYPERCDGPSS